MYGEEDRGDGDQGVVLVLVGGDVPGLTAVSVSRLLKLGTAKQTGGEKHARSSCGIHAAWKE